VISDAHEGLKAAIRRVFGASWQRCRVHGMRNALADVPKTQQSMVAAALRQAFLPPDRAQPDVAAHRRPIAAEMAEALTENDSAYLSKAFRVAVAAGGLKHKRTRPYTPRTNGKAERFIQTSLREWAYARPYASSHERSAALAPWLDHYNTQRPHAALAHHPPAARLRQSQLLSSTEGTVASSRPASARDRSIGPGQGWPQAARSVLCVGHVRQFGGESPLCNLMEVKH